jgi:hypothetical protein
MSRKDFVAVAAAIKNQYDAAIQLRNLPGQDGQSIAEGNTRVFTIERMANRLADVFSDANPRFNRNIFLAACGVTGGAR